MPHTARFLPSPTSLPRRSSSLPALASFLAFANNPSSSQPSLLDPAVAAAVRTRLHLPPRLLDSFPSGLDPMDNSDPYIATLDLDQNVGDSDSLRRASVHNSSLLFAIAASSLPSTATSCSSLPSSSASSSTFRGKSTAHSPANHDGRRLHGSGRLATHHSRFDGSSAAPPSSYTAGLSQSHPPQPVSKRYDGAIPSTSSLYRISRRRGAIDGPSDEEMPSKGSLQSFVHLRSVTFDEPSSLSLRPPPAVERLELPAVVAHPATMSVSTSRLSSEPMTVIMPPIEPARTSLAVVEGPSPLSRQSSNGDGSGSHLTLRHPASMMAGGLAAGARHRNTYPPLFNEPGMRHSISTQMFAPHGGGGGGADPATLGRSRQTLAERFSEMTSDSRGHSTTHLAAAATSGALHPTGSSHALSRRPSLSHMRSTADLGGTSGGPESSGGGVRRERLLLVNFNAMYQRTRQVHSEKRGAMCAAERWRFAIFSVLGSVRAINTFKVAPGPSSSSSTSAAAANGGRSNSVSSGSGGAAALDARAKFRLGDYLATPSFAISPEMRLTLEKHRSEYSADDYAMLERLTERMPSFEKYTPSVRKQLCRLLQYERFGPNRVMIKQGHDPKSFYIIVGGRCNVYKEENGIQIDLNELNSGDAFGELALLKNTKRNASVKTIAPSEFFRVDRDDFLEVLKGTAEQDIQQKLDFFQSIPFLAALPLPNLMRLAEVCSRREWPTNSVITREREPVSCISLIRTGSVRVLRVAPFRKVPRVDGRYSLEPVGFPDLSSGSSSGGGGSRVVDIDSDLMETDGGSVSSEAAAAAATAGTVYKLLCVGVLPPGQYFGQECIIEYTQRERNILNRHNTHHAIAVPPSVTNASLNSSAGLSSSLSDDPHRTVHCYTPHSIVTCEPTEILRVAKVDFVKHATPKALDVMLQAVRDTQSFYATSGGTSNEGSMGSASNLSASRITQLLVAPPLRVVQDAYLVGLRWAHLKRKVTQERITRAREKRRGFGVLSR